MCQINFEITLYENILKWKLKFIYVGEIIKLFYVKFICVLDKF